MDADLQDPPEIIGDMLKMWEEGVDDVYAKRRTRGKESFLRGSLSKLFYYILDKSTRYDVLKNVGDFRLLDRKYIDAIKQLRENERYTKFFAGQASTMSVINSMNFHYNHKTIIKKKKNVTKK